MVHETTQKKPDRQKWISLVVTVVLILVLVGLLTEEMEAVRTFIRESGWVGMLTSVLLYGLLGFSPIPSEPLTVMLTTVYGPLPAFLLAGVGNTFAAVLEYGVGAHLGGIADFEKRKAGLPFGLGRLPVNSAPFLLAARMLPGYGPKFVSLLGGIYRVPLWRYLWTAAIPSFAGAAIFAYGGFELIRRLMP